MTERTKIIIGDDLLDIQAALTDEPESDLLDRLLAEQEKSRQAGWPESVTERSVSAKQVSIDAIRDVLILARERIGHKESYTRDELLTAMGWAAYAAVLSSESHEVMTEGIRRQAVGNLADGRETWTDDYPPVPLFDEKQGEHDD